MFKAKLKSLEFLVKNQHRGRGVSMPMLLNAGKEVNITEVRDDGSIRIAEDKNYSYSEFMFEKLPTMPKSVNFRLTKESGSREMRVKPTGNIQSGCYNVMFADLEKIYKTAVKQREVLASAIAKQNKTSSKAKAKK